MFCCSPIGLHLEIAQPSTPPRNPGKPGSSGNMPKLTLIVLPSINSVPPNMEYPVEFSVWKIYICCAINSYPRVVSPGRELCAGPIEHYLRNSSNWISTLIWLDGFVVTWWKGNKTKSGGGWWVIWYHIHWLWSTSGICLRPLSFLIIYIYWWYCKHLLIPRLQGLTLWHDIV